MYLHALATANPPLQLTQHECWEIARRSELAHRLRDRSLALLEKVLKGDSGIERRHFATDDVERIYDLSADALNEAFRRHAPALAGAALRRALDAARLRPADLDALLVCTCTGYLCPGPSSYVAEALGLRSDAYLLDLVGQGCGAAIPLLRAAAHLCAAEPAAQVACVAVEVCSAAFYVDDDPGVLISACLFGDGAAATLWSGRPGPAGPLRCGDFDTLHRPEDRDLLRFEQRGGKLRNLLDRSVPAKAASAVAALHARARLHGAAAPHLVPHPGGRDVLNAVASALGEPPPELAASRTVLRRYGNMSSPSVLFGLDEHLSRHPQPNGAVWLTSFGAGFSAHSCRLSWD
jgi:predicted naringenin-chalcone synthase